MNNKVVIVAGATSRIGWVTAKKLAARGAKVVLAAFDLDLLRQLEHSLPGSLAIPTDLAVTADAVRLVAHTVGAWGRVDALVNCADEEATGPPVPALVKLVKQLMRRQGWGQIVSVRFEKPEGMKLRASQKSARNEPIAISSVVTRPVSDTATAGDVASETTTAAVADKIIELLMSGKSEIQIV